jgi:diguanylate cyclase (GGDEF)-like protein
MSLSQKFILVLLSIIVLIVSLLTYLNIKEDEKILNNALEKRVVLMKKNLTQNAKYTIGYYKSEIENDLSSMNLSHISLILKQLVDREMIEGTSLVNEDKSMQLFEGRSYHRNVKELTTEETKNNIIVSTPIVLSKHWGTLTLVYSLDAFNNDIMEVRKRLTKQIEHKVIYAVELGLVIFAIFAILSWFWARRLVSPILILTDTAKKMAEGNLKENEALLHIHRNDEVGVLANVFSDMSKKLSTSYKELETLNESLEAKIKERTKDLEMSQEELKVLASTDSMTKLYNRRYFSDISEKTFTESKITQTNIVLIMLDIDNFKNVNDTYGHHIGDKVIIAIAEILKGSTRKSDIVCRYGGEEYMIMLPKGNLDKSLEIAENIRELVSHLGIEYREGKTLHPTISIGIAETNIIVDANIETAINKADNALYEAKRSGKNKVVIYRDKV